MYMLLKENCKDACDYHGTDDVKKRNNYNASGSVL